MIPVANLQSISCLQSVGGADWSDLSSTETRSLQQLEEDLRTQQLPETETETGTRGVCHGAA